MTNLLSTVSGFFSKSLILGAFLPTLIFLSLFIFFIFQLLPSDYWLIEQLKMFGTEWQILSITFITVVVSCLLYNLNVSITRFYEGYPWENSWLGNWRKTYYKNEFIRIDARRKGIRSLIRAMINKDVTSAQKKEIAKKIVNIFGNSNFYISEKRRPFQHLLINEQMPIDDERIDNEWADDKWEIWLKELRKKRDELDKQFLNDFPGKENLVLPTRLGNVIRSFEYYPDREYGIDAVTIYPRLVAKIDKDYAAIIDDAKTSLDFFINCSFLSLILAFLLIATGLFINILQQGALSQIKWVGEILFFLALSLFAYRGAIFQAKTWGETVKSSFDLYRNDLLPQLGYPDVPKTKQTERKLWDNISVQMLYGDLAGVPLTDYNALDPHTPTTHINVTPNEVKLTVLRSIKYLQRENVYQITLKIRNEDQNKQTAENISLSDTLLNNMILRWKSAEILDVESNTSNSIVVTGVNPYLFEIGKLEFEKEKIVTYEVIVLTNQSSSKIFQTQENERMNYFEYAVNILMRSVGKTVTETTNFNLVNTFEDLKLTDQQDFEKLKNQIAYLLIPEFFDYFPELKSRMTDESVVVVSENIRTQLNISSDESLEAVALDIAKILSSTLPGNPGKSGRD